MLEVRNVTKKFGGLVAVNGVSFQLKHDILGVIGPNGSGKTTLLNCISGIYRVDGGSIYLNQLCLTRLRPYEIARSGVSRTFQVPRLFWSLKVLDNMLIPVLYVRKENNCLRKKAEQLLDYVELTALKNHLARELSGGQQKLLEFARALMSDPKIILLDEPFAGVHPRIKAIMHNRIRELYLSGVSFILVSHDIASIYDLSTRILAMDQGRKIAEGSAEEIQKNEEVITAYLGG